MSSEEFISELWIASVQDRGIPNEERIAIRCEESVDMALFGILVGVHLHDQSTQPIRDNFFWFGRGVIHPGEWILLFTGPGEGRTTVDQVTKKHVFTFHWFRKTTMFTSSLVQPMLIRMNGIQIPPHIPELPKGSPET